MNNQRLLVQLLTNLFLLAENNQSNVHEHFETMKTSTILLLALIATAVQANDDDNFEEDRSKALDFLRRSIFHPTLTKCEEQKREAKEDYEERCEPSNPIYRNQGTNRNCPDLNSWDAFKNYEIGDGLSSFDDLKPNIKLPKLPRLPSADEVSNKVYNKVTGLKRRAMFSPDDE